MLQKRLSLSLLACLAISSAFGDDRPINFSLGEAQEAESRMPVTLSDFNLSIHGNTKVTAHFLSDSVQWVRDSSAHLVPRALLVIEIADEAAHWFLHHEGKAIIFESLPDRARVQIYINLFSPGAIVLKNAQDKGAEISVRALKMQGKKNRLIDRSCTNFELQFEGAENDYLSLTCRLHRLGQWGDERPRLEILWSSPDLTLEDGTRPPFTAYLFDDSPAVTTVVDSTGAKRKISISAKLPARLHRLKTAIGLGPYAFKTNSPLKEKKERVAPSFMLYGRLDITEGSSFRIFDALVANGPVFNNSGFYFAYELAQAFDGRLLITPLLGVQGLYFKNDKSERATHRAIYPQGFEILYRDPFNIPKSPLVYGMFLLSSNGERYQNLWLRWGKRYFWELNYITWEKSGYATEMWGVSVGIPFISLF
jgi:hypothetical protein